METETSTTDEQSGAINQFAVLSKSLAVVLFATLTFVIGGWIGYTIGLQKGPDAGATALLVSEEKVTEEEIVTEEENSLPTLPVETEKTIVTTPATATEEKKPAPPPRTTATNAATAPFVTLLVPKNGDSFCLEHGMSIEWEASDGIEYFGIGANKPNWGLPVGQQLAYRDTASKTNRYSYKWNFRDRAGNLIEPGHLYSISIAAFNASSVSVANDASPGKFSVIKCNF